WKHAYRGRNSECVVGSLVQGKQYAFRCARENADGTVGPWSEELVRFSPASKKNENNVKIGNNNVVWRNDRRHDDPPKGSAGCDIGSTSTGRAPGPAPWRSPSPLRPLPPPPLSQQQQQQQQQQQPRFDLLVPALIETFARLVDDGGHHHDHQRHHHHHRATDAIASVHDPSTPNSAPSTTEHASADDTTHTKDADAASTAGGHEEEKEAARQAQEGERKRMVWEEHWDDGRQAPFYRLSGTDLSLWQIPAL
ncbi:unnamed protein product, partial [Laminaria digitata]